eukprot:SAG11_NODE_13874_length_635_cov_0.944030_1_plen_78_part_00
MFEISMVITVMASADVELHILQLRSADLLFGVGLLVSCSLLLSDIARSAELRRAGQAGGGKTDQNDDLNCLQSYIVC